MAQTTRMTKQRALILEELRKVTSHPSADEIYMIVREKMPKISLGTVYRNLDFLAESNEILKLEYAGFQKRFDGRVENHQHIRCEFCGKVSDVMPEIPMPEVHSAAIDVPGYQVTSARLEFFGVCADCQKKQ